LHLRHPDIGTVYLRQVNQDLVAGDGEVCAADLPEFGATGTLHGPVAVSTPSFLAPSRRA